MNRIAIYNFFFSTYIRRALTYGVPFGLISTVFASRPETLPGFVFLFVFSAAFYGLLMALFMGKTMDKMGEWIEQDADRPVRSYMKLLKSERVPDNESEREDFKEYLTDVLERFESRKGMYSKRLNILSGVFLSLMFIATLLLEETRPFAIIYPIVFIVTFSSYLARKRMIAKIKRVQKKLN